MGDTSTAQRRRSSLSKFFGTGRRSKTILEKKVAWLGKWMVGEEVKDDVLARLRAEYSTNGGIKTRLKLLPSGLSMGDRSSFFSVSPEQFIPVEDIKDLIRDDVQTNTVLCLSKRNGEVNEVTVFRCNTEYDSRQLVEAYSPMISKTGAGFTVDLPEPEQSGTPWMLKKKTYGADAGEVTDTVTVVRRETDVVDREPVRVAVPSHSQTVVIKEEITTTTNGTNGEHKKYYHKKEPIYAQVNKLRKRFKHSSTHETKNKQPQRETSTITQKPESSNQKEVTTTTITTVNGRNDYLRSNQMNGHLGYSNQGEIDSVVIYGDGSPKNKRRSQTTLIGEAKVLVSHDYRTGSVTDSMDDDLIYSTASRTDSSHSSRPPSEIFSSAYSTPPMLNGGVSMIPGVSYRPVANTGILLIPTGLRRPPPPHFSVIKPIEDVYKPKLHQHPPTTVANHHPVVYSTVGQPIRPDSPVDSEPSSSHTEQPSYYEVDRRVPVKYMS